jgi:alkyl sulfatase BDS1-like metallo-beta-lactamase superfamily hydrolase
MFAPAAASGHLVRQTLSMADLLSLSARIIDSGEANEPVNRVTNELSEVADGVAVVESFSHSIAFRTGEGLVVFDASGAATGQAVVESLRGWDKDRTHSLVYTHGHLDHVGGSPAFVADAEARGHPRPAFFGHRAVRDRFERYRLTDAWNRTINMRQFGWLAGRAPGLGIGGQEGPDIFGGRFLPEEVAEPDVTYEAEHLLSVGGVEFELRHAKGETDDHTWAWIPSHRAICSGDFLIWYFPNAGNPQKVQRYPLEWVRALRDMVAMEPELLLPAHGLPIAGRDRIAAVLTNVADVLQRLVGETIEMMNAGATLDEIVHTVKVSEADLTLPYLQPFYDEPEFVVRNVWRLYGGWWDGNPARLKPPPDAALAGEVAALAGGTSRLCQRARELAEAGRLDLACQLVEWAFQAGDGDAQVHDAMADIYRRRHGAEASLMAKGIFASAARR